MCAPPSARARASVCLHTSGEELFTGLKTWLNNIMVRGTGKFLAPGNNWATTKGPDLGGPVPGG